MAALMTGWRGDHVERAGASGVDAVEGGAGCVPPLYSAALTDPTPPPALPTPPPQSQRLPPLALASSNADEKVPISGVCPGAG